jgi:hypothetical protein
MPCHQLIVTLAPAPLPPFSHFQKTTVTFRIEEGIFVSSDCCGVRRRKHAAGKGDELKGDDAFD